MNQVKTNPVGWILYNESCGICRQWVPFWERTLQKRGFEIAPLQANWVKNKLQLSESDLLQDLRLLLTNGETVQGEDTYRYAMERIWWAYLVYLFQLLRLAGIFSTGATGSLPRTGTRFRGHAKFPATPPTESRNAARQNFSAAPFCCDGI
jgi:predicted DCC family thiol-disulfide oxidoreductase YuxK